MFKVGEIIRYIEPLDHDYSYGKILSIDKGRATIEGLGYYAGKVVSIKLRYIEHLERGRNCESKKYYK